MPTAAKGRTSLRRRIAAGVGLSLLVHGCVVLLLWRARPAAPRLEPDRVEVEVIARPAEPAPAPPAPTIAEAPPEPARRAPARRAGVKRAPAAPESAAAPEAPSSAPTVSEDHSLLRMRGPGDVTLMPTGDTLARALGPEEAPAGPEKPARRKPRLPGTGLTTLEPEIDDKVRQIHPRFFEVLTNTERHFKPDAEKMADEVRGDLSASTSLKRWLFGGLAGDPEAMKNQVPTLACLVCVTLRPQQPPEIELAGASGSRWFDKAATESIRRAVVPKDDTELFDPARACYRFAAKVWRTRPDLTNLAIPFKLNFQHSVKLVSYQKLGG